MIEIAANPLASRETLRRSLNQAAAWGPEYGGGLANHLPMVLHAAWELGADADRLQAQIKLDSPELELPEPAGHMLPNWQDGLGEREAYSDLRIHFESMLAKQGWDETLQAVLPILAPGLIAHAFHGLIRTAHAYESGCEAEMAAALAAWACEWTEPAAPEAPVERLTWAAWRREARSRLADFHSDLHLIQQRMTAATGSLAYRQLGDAPAFAPSLAERREQLLELALNLYLDTRNFTVLHMITALRALRVLAAFIPDTAAMQSALTRAALLALISCGLKPHGRPLPEPLPDWNELKRRALAQWNDHIIKLTHACWQEDALRPDPRWRQAPALLLGLSN
ncbi:questin oxidase family protein [Chromobacterium sp. IIBBL 290-4]|uniref:questin oxidase family protein n=1 Tax=Chromobacterium sp. IIBBL 290-4 TaxID=2953890 RepID=UPI0020B69A7C|nr:questin oxidase family protein [Chromobacterium sp. IIBBL 290-4]UTH73539.1 questin oxidase family protein [Chromobacterium sp. IIBBL 290-4]